MLAGAMVNPIFRKASLSCFLITKTSNSIPALSTYLNISGCIPADLSSCLNKEPMTMLFVGWAIPVPSSSSEVIKSRRTCLSGCCTFSNCARCSIARFFVANFLLSKVGRNLPSVISFAASLYKFSISLSNLIILFSFFFWPLLSSFLSSLYFSESFLVVLSILSVVMFWILFTVNVFSSWCLAFFLRFILSKDTTLLGLCLLRAIYWFSTWPWNTSVISPTFLDSIPTVTLSLLVLYLLYCSSSFMLSSSALLTWLIILFSESAIFFSWFFIALNFLTSKSFTKLVLISSKVSPLSRRFAKSSFSSFLSVSLYNKK